MRISDWSSDVCSSDLLRWCFLSRFVAKIIRISITMPESVINNDQRYIDGLLKNDDKIIAAIYRNFAGKINHWICANSGTSDDAADIFQESIISIYRQAKDKKLMLTCPFEPFFLMVCKRKWWNELKKRSRQGVTISLESVSETGQEPEALASELMMMEEKDLLIQQFFRKLGER